MARFSFREVGVDYELGAETREEAEEELAERLTDAYSPVDHTLWADAWLIEDEDEDSGEMITVEIHPPEPECSGDEHDWSDDYDLLKTVDVGGIKENPGVFGHGGGVIIHRICTHCGCHRIEDTWAQRPDTGEQGLTSISYIACAE